MLETCSRWANDCVNAVFPTVEHAGLIASALSTWEADRVGAYCWRCGESATPAGFDDKGCPQCRTRRLNWSRLFRLGAYEPPLEDWIHAMKFARRWAWGDALGVQLAMHVAADAAWCDKAASMDTVVCPVPMHYRRRFSRGYNQAQRIAAAFAHQRQLRMLELLRRHRSTPPQTAIHPNQREDNVRHAFSMVSTKLKLDGLHIVLVDDIKTSGGTLRACTRTLRDAGAKEVTCLVAAVADHHPKIEVV